MNKTHGHDTIPYPLPTPSKIPWRISGAFFLAGFGTFALIYDVQPLLPEFPADFHVSPATASLALSLTTLLLSFSMLVAGRVSEVVDRRRLMSASIITASLLSIASALSPDWQVFIFLRALTGIALGGLPAVALAYLADNVDPHRLAATVGLYVSGTAFGGMSGRLLGGIITSLGNWRYTVGIVGALCLLSGLLFFFSLPVRDRRSSSPNQPWRELPARFLHQWKDPVLRCLFIEGGFLLGCFVATFNYLCFRLLEEPFSFSQGKISLVFLLYFSGMIVSPLCGRLINCFGAPWVLRGAFLTIALGGLVSASDFLPLTLLGISLVIVGFFAGHATASGWVNRRVVTGKAIASAQYLTVYYIGASLLGWLGGFAWQFYRWSGVVTLIAVAAVLAAALVPASDSE